MAIAELPTQVFETSIQTFERLYQENGHDVSWAKHNPNSLTTIFVDNVIELAKHTPRNFHRVFDFGCGGGGKTIVMSNFLRPAGVEVKGYDYAPTAIKLARERLEMLELDSAFISFDFANVLDLKPENIGQALGIHEYQVSCHIPPELHEDYVRVIGSLLVPGGQLLLNLFNRNTQKFYSKPIANARIADLVVEDGVPADGMFCHFYTEDEIRQLYEPYFYIGSDSLLEVPHPTDPNRVHWDILMTRK